MNDAILPIGSPDSRGPNAKAVDPRQCPFVALRLFDLDDPRLVRYWLGARLWNNRVMAIGSIKRRQRCSRFVLEHLVTSWCRPSLTR